MTSLKKFNGTTWDNAKVRKLGTSTDTLTTLPADIYADGSNATVGLVGNMQQTGTPTPDSPVMPQGTGERTGNLLRFYQEEMQGSFYGVDVTVKNAEITLNGTVTIGSGHWVEIGYKFGGGTDLTDNVVIPCEPETPYTIATEILDGNSTQVRIIVFGTSNENRTVNIGSSLTTTFSGDINRIFISLGAEGVVFNNLKFRVMFNKGSAPLPYEPYGIKIPISSANTTTPVYLGEVESTRRIKKLVLTGKENWALSNNRLMYTVKTTEAVPYESVLCTHYTSSKSFIEVYNTTNSTAVTNQGIYVNSGSTDIADFKSYLSAQYSAGTPVTIWYVLSTPQTAVVNEPLRKIGDYADTVSGITIPTTTGADSFDVLTTLKPSEVELTYTGWHDANVQECDGSEWQ